MAKMGKSVPLLAGVTGGLLLVAATHEWGRQKAEWPFWSACSKAVESLLGASSEYRPLGPPPHDRPSVEVAYQATDSSSGTLVQGRANCEFHLNPTAPETVELVGFVLNGQSSAEMLRKAQQVVKAAQAPSDASR